LNSKELHELAGLCENYSLVFEAEGTAKLKLPPNELKRYKHELTLLRQYHSFFVALNEQSTPDSAQKTLLAADAVATTA